MNPSSPSTQQIAAPRGLLCDLLAMPERGSIATRVPTFGWIPHGGMPGAAQSGYQILVATHEDLLASGQSDLWDTQRVNSAQSINIEYGGSPLQWSSTYYWTVRTWHGSDAASPWSLPQEFTLADEKDHTDVSVYSLMTTRLLPKITRQEKNGVWFLDFGRHAFGWLEIKIAAPRTGAIVKVRMGETLKNGRIERTPEGSIRYEESLLTLDAATQIYRPEIKPGPLNMRDCAIKLPAEIGQVMPFRYAEIEGLDEPPEAVFVRVQHPFNESAASFHSSSPELDEIWEFCRYSMLATSFTGYYVDGDRERIPYEADVYINQLSHYAVDREFSMARRTHEYLLRNSTWPTEWKQHSILIAWADYEATGDARSLARNYDILRNDKLLLDHARADGLLDTRALRDIVDWPVCERDDYDFRSINTVVNAFHFRTLVLLARIARVLDRKKEAHDFDLRAAQVAEAFNSVCWDENAGLYIDGEGSRHASFHANLFALAFDLIPKDRLTRVLPWLKGRGMACSVYPAQFLLEGLFKAGEANHALDLILAEGLRSWHNMLAKGATITWEAWDQSIKPNQDWNHAWGAAPGNIIARYILGVQPLEPGYGRVRVSPQLGRLTEAEGVIPTIRGDIQVRAWRSSPDAPLNLSVKVPVGVSVETPIEESPATEGLISLASPKISSRVQDQISHQRQMV